ncbi:hypothetical protein OROGR_030626 [Orobanche gracilis]
MPPGKCGDMNSGTSTQILEGGTGPEKKRLRLMKMR